MSPHDDLEKEISDILSGVIIIDQSVEEFINFSTGMTPDPAFLKEAISCEISEFEAAVDLIFSPDDDARIRVERFIPRSFNLMDEKNLIDKITGLKLSCTLRFAGSGVSLTVPVPERSIGRFVRRLNLTAGIPWRLRELTEKHFSGRECTVLKVIREKAGALRSLDLIVDFLENISDLFQPEIEDLDIIMTVSGMFPEETSLLAAINLAFRKWDSALKKHEDMEKALFSGCMEELMAKGMRIQAINREDIEKKIASADRIISLFRFRPSPE
ncbi:hypothetical protein [Desulforegula conservatrix]|uniref:hypothetical protein n=1 Tax=Desulforegula conservatrix TaxID=153026 RepID=UPI00041CBA4B|nr:hypothetical protein [Desulforegula conservatrix]